MPTSSFSSFSLSNLGPLTTTFTAPSSCATQSNVMLAYTELPFAPYWASSCPNMYGTSGDCHPSGTVYDEIVSSYAAETTGVITTDMPQGNIFYFSTLHYSPQTLQSVPSMHPSKLGRRATNYFVLGYSLPALLDLNSGSPLEYLRALSSLLQEFETYQNLMGMDSSGNSLSKGRVQQMFKLGARNAQSKGRRTSSVQDGITLEGRDILGLPKPAGTAGDSIGHNSV